MTERTQNGSTEQPESSDRDRSDDLAARVAALELAIAEMTRTSDQRYTHLVNAMGHQFEVMEKRADGRHRALVEILAIRFDQVDRRFDQVDRRFEQVDRRFEQERATTNEQFRSMQQYIDRRLKEERAMTAGQFESMQRRMDDRFDRLIEALDLRFGRLER